MASYQPPEFSQDGVGAFQSDIVSNERTRRKQAALKNQSRSQMLQAMEQNSAPGFWPKPKGFNQTSARAHPFARANERGYQNHSISIDVPEGAAYCDITRRMMPSGTCRAPERRKINPDQGTVELSLDNFEQAIVGFTAYDGQQLGYVPATKEDADPGYDDEQ